MERSETNWRWVGTSVVAPYQHSMRFAAHMGSVWGTCVHVVHSEHPCSTGYLQFQLYYSIQPTRGVTCRTVVTCAATIMSSPFWPQQPRSLQHHCDPDVGRCCVLKACVVFADALLLKLNQCQQTYLASTHPTDTPAKPTELFKQWKNAST